MEQFLSIETLIIELLLVVTVAVDSFSLHLIRMK
jgi:hypothetical protein